jgi:magnesium transporter
MADLRVLRLENGTVRRGGKELATPGATIWVDLPPTPEHLAWLGETFHFHPLALEDCAHEDQRVKFEQYPGALFTVTHRLAPAPDDSELHAFELHSFLTAEALVTVHSAPIAEIDRVFDRCSAEPEVLARGADFAMYLVHDAITDVHFSLVDALTSEVEEIAEEALQPRTAEDDLLARIVGARRMHALLRRRLSPQREVYAALARPGQLLVREQTAIYFRDIVDHVVRLTEETDMGRELVASAMEAYLTQSNNRMSAVTARLTLAATIFLPLNFLAGFFGMNLEILPPRVAIPVVLAAMVAIPSVLFLAFRKKGWL